ncbi:FAD-dependent monooxygenase [Agrobacterium sp. rho-8.1]|nr:FAD-dependent monooxygenase [Agrobacterium sp. rho-8.1]
MFKTDDFYFDVLRQVRMDRWSDGRVVLTGDAAWRATPLSGIGTTLAVIGGYVLAGELSKTDDLPSALAGYERVMRPFVKEGQGVPKIVPRMLWPHSRLGLAVLRGTMRVAGTPLVRKTFSNLYLRDSKKIELPDYADASTI